MKLPSMLRRVLDPLTERVPIPVVSGVNAGRWWGLASAGSGYASGRRASGQMRVLDALVREGDTMWDVGAHHGYVTLMASKRVGSQGCAHAFEPSQANGRILRRHLRWNQCDNATVHAHALGGAEGESNFGGGNTSKMHALGQGDERVRVRRADAMIAEGACGAPTFLKVDIEGAESDFLDGLGEALPRNARGVIAMHSAHADQLCAGWLQARGFTLIPSRALRTARDGQWHADPDLYFVGPDDDLTDVCRILSRLGEIDA